MSKNFLFTIYNCNPFVVIYQCQIRKAPAALETPRSMDQEEDLLLDRSLAHPAPPTTTEPAKLPGYVLRGLGIFELHRDEILAAYQGAGRWLVPSGTETGRHYEVRVGSSRHPERSRCECTGYQHHEHCSHLVCAQIAHRKSAVCDSCGERHWWPELTEVQEDDELLTWFPGDRLCDDCRSGHWA
jgi:hypothetical protein